MATNEKPIFELRAQSNDDSAEKLETIKNLIFGDKIEAYEAEFELLKKDIEAKRKDMMLLIEEVRDELSKSIEDVSLDVNSRLTNLEENIDQRLSTLEDNKLTSDMLSDLFINLGKKLGEKK